MKITIKDLLPFCATAKMVKEAPVKEKLNGVLHSEGWMVACDGEVLVAVKAPYPPENEGKIINKKGEVIEAKYPNWKSVIPNSWSDETPIDYPLLNEWCGALKERTDLTPLKIGEQCFNALKIKTLLKILKKLEFKKFYINNTSRRYPAPIYSRVEKDGEIKAHVLLMLLLASPHLEDGILTYPHYPSRYENDNN